MDGYNRRELNEWRRTRKLYTLLFNVNVKHPKKERQLMPLPGEDVAYYEIDPAENKRRFDELARWWVPRRKELIRQIRK